MTTLDQEPEGEHALDVVGPSRQVNSSNEALKTCASGAR